MTTDGTRWPLPVINCDAFGCRSCHPGVRYEFGVYAVDQRAAVEEATKRFAEVPGSDRYAIVETNPLRGDMSFSGGARTPEWSVEVKAEEIERAALLGTVAALKDAVRAVLDAGENPDPALLDAVWKLVEA